jgi:hypothetical protein
VRLDGLLRVDLMPRVFALRRCALTESIGREVLPEHWQGRITSDLVGDRDPSRHTFFLLVDALERHVALEVGAFRQHNTPEAKGFGGVTWLERTEVSASPRLACAPEWRPSVPCLASTRESQALVGRSSRARCSPRSSRPG